MPATVLERLFVTERQRQRIARDGTLAMPSIHERNVSEGVGPLVVTNARSTFVMTRRRADGVARSGFSHCPLHAEEALLTEMYHALGVLGARYGWANRFSSIAAARARMSEPRLLVVSDGLLKELGGDELTAEDAEKLMATRGYIVESDGLRVLAGGLPSGAMVLGAPSSTGFYVRSGDWLSILIQRADQSVMLVGDGLG